MCTAVRVSSTQRNKRGIVRVLVARACSSMFCIITVRTTETGEPIAGPYSCLQCLPLYWKNVEVRQRLSRCIMSTVGSGIVQQ